jgi:hypothetical protein
MFLNTDPHTAVSKTFFESQMLAYNGYLAEIMSSANVELANAKVAEALCKVSSLVGDIARNAPAGSENAMALLLSSVTSAQISYERTRQAAVQAQVQAQAQSTPARADGAVKSKRNLLG